MLMKEQSDKFPRMVKLTQQLYSAPLGDAGVVETVEREFAKLNLGDKIGPGKTVALGAGSRGVASIDLIIKTLVAQVKALGAEAFVFPAMGSHGGATGPGQKDVLETLGVTEEYIGCPIKSSLEVIELGQSPSGVPRGVGSRSRSTAAPSVLASNSIASEPTRSAMLTSLAATAAPDLASSGRTRTSPASLPSRSSNDGKKRKSVRIVPSMQPATSSAWPGSARVAESTVSARPRPNAARLGATSASVRCPPTIGTS